MLGLPQGPKFALMSRLADLAAVLHQSVGGVAMQTQGRGRGADFRSCLIVVEEDLEDDLAERLGGSGHMSQVRPLGLCSAASRQVAK